MSHIIEIKTDRLLLRQWHKNDFEPFAKLNANDAVMKYFPNALTSAQSNEFASSIQQRIATNGWGFWAIEIIKNNNFIGFVGLNKPLYSLPFSLQVEIGWRLDECSWNKGYATEAANAALTIGFTQLNFSEVVSFTSVLNQASINVMKRLHMQDTNFLFEHPKVPHDHKLLQHCLYKITQDEWIKNKGEGT